MKWNEKEQKEGNASLDAVRYIFYFFYFLLRSCIFQFSIKKIAPVVGALVRYTL